MSYVLMMTADKPLPLCDRREERESVSVVSNREYTISFVRGFRVAEHRYYRHAVDDLGLSMKPYQYQLGLEIHEKDLSDFKDYLKEQFASGEEAELWNLWVGVDRSGHVPHYQGRLADFDMETLEQLCRPPSRNGLPGQCRMTITI